ncbi:putative signal transduction protein [uncultured Desulfobacterium sp.]|uniref:Putative signal transduction protein n=1 Tax=uncultured Desulfobacterium sp. TaxID=201089 RepID=A0A445N2H1_9BACT|nr:putative signal transduction protein [uncultured Desulfobacterium sp.]
MTIVHSDDLREDMILSEDVKDVGGRLLLKKGQKIHQNHVNIIKKWGVTEVNVVGVPAEEQDTEEPEARRSEEIEREITRIFKHTDLDHPAIKELSRLAVPLRLERPATETAAKMAPAKLKDTRDNVTVNVLKKIRARNFKLPEIPKIAFELNDILADPLSTADELARVVSKSPSLTTILLKIVNSSFYGFSSKIDTISRAVTIIGTREISSLAILICEVTVFKNIPSHVLDMNLFLRHSFFCGLISRMLAATKNIEKTEQLFIGGLLHDIGRVIIYKHFSEQAESLLRRCIESENILYREEDIFLGCRHTDISRLMLQEWHFPPELEDMVFSHHDPMSARNPVEASILHLADIITNGLGMGTSGERLVPPLDYKAWELLGLSPGCFDVVIRQAIHQLSIIEPFLQ